MDFLETIVDFVINLVTDFAGEAATKKNKLALKSEIKTCERLINRSYCAIGRKYYEKYVNGGADAEFEKQMKEIKNAKAAIADLEGKLEDIKNN